MPSFDYSYGVVKVASIEAAFFFEVCDVSKGNYLVCPESG